MLIRLVAGQLVGSPITPETFAQCLDQTQARGLKPHTLSCFGMGGRDPKRYRVFQTLPESRRKLQNFARFLGRKSGKVEW